MNTTLIKPIVLIVLDGWGILDERKNNAIAQANTPFYDKLWEQYPHSLLDASEEKVGLPTGQMGNSEIGHMTIGAGKTIDTDLVRIAKAIKDKTWDTNPAFTELFDHVKQYNSTLHIQGLVSPGGVHSHSSHLYAFLESAKNAGITNVVIHAFTDGRDTPPQSAASYLQELEDVIEKVGIGFIATAAGRFYAMDRDNNWDRLQKAEDAIFSCKGKICELKKPSEVFQELYKEGVLDEHTEPLVFLDENGKSYPVQENDGIFFFNFRSDRGRMLSKKIIEKSEEKNLCFVTMTQYNKTFTCRVAFPPIGIDTTLAAEVSKAGLTQAHIAETEKYPHATYFLNGGKQDPHTGEEHILIESRKDVQTHDLAPKMRAKEIADKALEQLEQKTDFIFINFANADMVGHTANQPAILEAVEEVDRQLQRVVEATHIQNGVVFITADHGNAEVMIDPVTGEKHTAHTTNLVPGILTDTTYTLRESGTLADITPTILSLFNIKQPESMTGANLLIS
ncbi:MAG TPA: 2,3-bisphosphoglycerate-independent phosphoglycerate mutase [Candidatus Andersenbacteria bacterium]|nr:2,3-bisphosphoglycerate-independent phosphoglycerate mutase [Candidatus Andersenbacteria bacterium]